MLRPAIFLGVAGNDDRLDIVNKRVRSVRPIGGLLWGVVNTGFLRLVLRPFDIYRVSPIAKNVVGCAAAENRERPAH